MSEAIALIELEQDYDDVPVSVFNVSQPFSACRLCGAVHQSSYDRLDPYNPQTWQERRKWTFDHARTHSKEEHLALRDSGEVVTDIARKRLSELGIHIP